MKYEMIFGDERRFNEQNNEMAEVMLWHDCLGPNFVSIKELSRMNLEGAIPHGSVVLAMRRIIRTPTWTAADQKAGKLPEVGVMLNHKTQGECTFIGTGVDNKSYWALKLKNDLIYIAEKNWCAPIELPEEKAARLREEWCSTASKMLKNLEYSSTLTSIYDALLSGDLPVPVKEK